MANRKFAGRAVGVAAACLLAGCSGHQASPGSPASAPGPGIAITVSTNTCGTGWQHPAAGLLTFEIRNISPQVVDVSLTNPGTAGVYAEIEALGPGITRPMQVNVGSGTYAFQCDNGFGSPLTGPTTVIPGNVPGGLAVTPPDATATLTAVTSDRTYITQGLVTVAGQVSVLVSDIEAGDLTAARGAWLTAHLSYERLGSAYGMFNEYDDEIDGTPDGLPGGVNDPSFTGFYRIEYGLWHGQSAAELTEPAQELSRDIASLRAAFPGMAQYPQAALSDLALRTHEILEHAIRFQLSGADDYGSGTTLATADANIDATRAQLAMLQPVLTGQYAALPQVYAWLNRLQRLIDSEHTGNGWTPVSALTTTKREDIDSAAAETVQLLAPIAVMFESSPQQ
jgi:iron uptake system EfeUOB component EfeO/EfeM